MPEKVYTNFHAYKKSFYTNFTPILYKNTWNYKDLCKVGI